MKAILLFLISFSVSFSATAEDLGMTVSDKSFADSIVGIFLVYMLLWVMPK